MPAGFLHALQCDTGLVHLLAVLSMKNRALITLITIVAAIFGSLSQPLALVVIGGLVSSTLLTLVVLPVVYLLVEGGRERRANRRAARTAEATAPVPAPAPAPMAAADSVPVPDPDSDFDPDSDPDPGFDPDPDPDPDSDSSEFPRVSTFGR